MWQETKTSVPVWARFPLSHAGKLVDDVRIITPLCPFPLTCWPIRSLARGRLALYVWIASKHAASRLRLERVFRTSLVLLKR